MNWVGDVLFSTPFIKAVRESNPSAHIACLLHPRCKEILEDNRRIDEIIIYDEEGAHRSLSGKWKLIKELKKKRFDIAFLLHRSFTKALIACLAGIKERVGYPTKNRGFILTKTVDSPLEEPHKVEYFLNIARAYDIVPADVSYEFVVREQEREYIRGFLRSEGVGDGERLVVLCPAGNWPPKRWPAENFARLADELSETSGVRIAIAASGKDLKLAEDIRSVMAAVPVMASGRTSLKQLAALLERADLVVANDTGPMHMAVAVGAKTIALFGPTSPRLTGPYGKGSYRVISKDISCDIPCYDLSCKDHRCMSSIKVEDVLKEAKEMLTRL